MQILEFPNISGISHVQHAVFTRHGGCSRGPYDSLNLSFGVGDEHAAVLENRRLVSRYLKAAVLVFANQVHGKKILVVEEAPLPGHNPVFLSAGTGDALITNLSGLFLVIQTADCQSVMLADSRKQVVANVHVGWRGNAQNIIGLTVGEMKHRFGCNPSDLQVAVGPSLGPCCAEFVNYKSEIPDAFWRYKDSDDRFDLWAVSSQQLAAAGVLETNTFFSKVCTKCHVDRFFSYRAQHVTGRFASAIALR
jgi:purine-nucleoside/S-methyl-5'-thioadenosine phosphorylase / adenosine deaminase